MKIVIDIPNWLYNAIKECNEPHYSKSLGDAVRDGTPLKQEPKTDLKPLFCKECGITDMQPLYMQRFCRFCGAKMESEE